MSCVREGGGWITQDHQIRKLLKDVRHSSGEVIDCNGETDNDVPPVTKMREHAKIALTRSQTSSSSSGYETTYEEEIARTRENRPWTVAQRR